MSSKDMYTKLDIARELLANRYLLSTVLVNLSNLIDLINERDKVISSSLSKDKQKELRQIKKKSKLIEFEHFAITTSQYNALIKQFPPEVINDACIILDKHIAETGHYYSNPYMKLKQWAISLALKERLSDYASSIVLSTREIDYRIIDNKELAMKYYYATPEWKREIDEACIYLNNKFNIKNKEGN